MRRDDLIRFVTRARHPPYGHRSGILQAAWAVARKPDLAKSEGEELMEALDWFNDNLAEPRRLAVSRHPHAREVAISWIRASAVEHVARLRRLAVLLDQFDVAVEELRTRRPGYIVWEDDHQIVAHPFTDTPC